MIEEFIHLFTELFPSIAPYTEEKTVSALVEYREKQKALPMLMKRSLTEIAQGDIFDNIHFSYVDDNGEELEFISKGMLISNTCDAHNKNRILFAPVIDLSELEGQGVNVGNLKQNIIYRILYIPDTQLADYAIDLSIINSYSTKLINDLVNRGAINKICSLSRFGFYFLIAKLTTYLLRPENALLNSKRIA